MNRKITMGSLFDGIAGFPLAAVINGIEPIWASEIEPFPIAVSKQSFPDIQHLGDIKNLDGEFISPIDIVTGGSPCQNLSIAGKREGLSGSQSSLFLEQVRIIKEMRENDIKSGRKEKEIRPRIMVWENVPGAFSSAKGEDFKRVLEEICKVADETITIPRPSKNKWLKAGCIMGKDFSIAWRLLDAQYWGVPQRRRRIFLVADFGGYCAPEVLFVPCFLSRNPEKGKDKWEKAAENFRRSASKSISKAVNILPFDTSFMLSPHNHSIPQFGAPCHTFGARSHVPKVLIEDCYCVAARQANTEIFNENTYHSWKKSDVSSTLKSSGGFCGGGSENLTMTKSMVRKLTPLECERLQGFPDNWTLLIHKGEFSDEEFEFWKSIYSIKKRPKKESTKKQVLNWYNKLCSDSARYRALGNSVAIPCVKFVMQRIKEVCFKEVNL